MKRRLILFSGSLAMAVALLAAGSAWWERLPPDGAWEVERPDRVLADFTVGEKVTVPFALRNRWHEPLRLLGHSAC
jgi:uncharacterized iron-regulated membrane protein